MNTVAKRFATFAPAQRQCSQLKKKAGNYRVIYIGPRVPHNFTYYKNITVIAVNIVTYSEIPLL